MARTLAEDDNKVLNNSSFRGGKFVPTSDSDLLGEEVLEAFLDSALENDAVLRGILDEGLTQIIRGAIRLLNLQRGRDRDRGHSRGNKEEWPVSFTPSSGEGEDDPTSGLLGDRDDKELETFLDSSLENDQVLRGILDEGFCFGGEEDDLLGDENDLETFLDSALGNDQVLRGILDEGMTQIIRGAIRLLNLQRQREDSRSQGHRCEKKPAPKVLKNVMNVDDGLKNSAVHGDQVSSSKGPDDNPVIVTRTVINSEEGKVALEDGTTSESQPDPFVESTSSDGGLKLEGGIKMTPAGKIGKRILKPCCYFCQKTFPTLSSLELHMATHTQEKPFPCPHCGKELRQRGHLNVHLRTHRKEMETPFICNLCGKGLTAKTTLEDHIRRHLKEKWFKCPQEGCSSSFVSSGELNQHSRVHSGERPFACPHPGCGKTFSMKSTLTDHSRIHSGEKPFACSHPGCTSSFNNGSNLRRHARVHSGEVPFPCEFPNCGKHFTTKYGRDGHHRLHTGEKPFVCGCGKAYGVYATLYSHRKGCEEGNRATKRRKICQDDG